MSIQFSENQTPGTHISIESYYVFLPLHPTFFFQNYEYIELFWVFIHRLRLEESELVTAWTIHGSRLISMLMKSSTVANSIGNKMAPYLYEFRVNGQ